MGSFTISRAPLRISFFGGGTDYPEFFRRHGGAVLGSAIDKFSYTTASTFISRLFDYRIRLSYRENEQVGSLAEIKHPVYREALRLLGLERDIELHHVADLPAFSGLGSSSAFTVALLQALQAFKGQAVAGLELAHQAIHLEQRILKEQVGCQDQTFAAVGGLNIIEFHREDEILIHPLALPPARVQELASQLLLFFTQITRRSADLVGAQLERLPENTATLLKMRAMVDQGFDILSGCGSLTPFGELLHQAWESKKTLAKNVSNAQINRLYDSACRAGAIGGKLLGVGGGGFLLLFVPPERQAAVRTAVSGHQEVDFKLNAAGAQIIF